jgi:hypothetical protein
MKRQAEIENVLIISMLDAVQSRRAAAAVAGHLIGGV